MMISTPSRRLLRNHDTLVVWLQRVVNVIFVAVSLLVLSWWRDGNIADQYRYMAIIGALLMLGVYDLTGVYRRYAEDRLAGVQQLARSWGIVVIMPVSYTHLRAHETVLDLVCRLLLEKKQNIYRQTARSH